MALLVPSAQYKVSMCRKESIGLSVIRFQHASMRVCSAADSEMLGDVILMPLAVCCKSLGEFWGFNWALEWRKGILPCQLKRLFLLPLGGQSPRQS